MKTWFVFLILTLIACGENSGVPSIENPDMTVPNESPSSSYFENNGFQLVDSHANILRRFSMTAPDENGHVAGFNLDGQDTPDGDPAHCGKGDFTDAEGRTGIDNQFADLWEVVEPLVGEATEALIQGAVNEGRILMTIELEGVDNFQNDDEVYVHIFRGRMTPDIGNLGLISPNQTIYVDESFPSPEPVRASIVNGHLEVNQTVIYLPVDILDAYFEMRIDNASLRMRIADDGSFEGYFGGIVDLDYVFSELLQTNASQEAELVQPIFYTYADMNKSEDGCSHVSAAFGFSGTPAFVVRYPESTSSEN